jgi:hypothetical protein
MYREPKTFRDLLIGDTRVVSFNRVRDRFLGIDGFSFALGYGHPTRGTSKDGSHFVQLFHPNWDRYKTEEHLRRVWKGWQQWDTDQDAWYYGVWVNFSRRMIVTYCEGDLYITISLDDASYKAEIQRLKDFHGEAPVTAWAIDADGTQTLYQPDWPDFEAYLEPEA